MRERGRRSRRRHQEEEVEEEGEGREVSQAAARCSTTGLGPRGMRVRYCPSGSVSQVLNCAQAFRPRAPRPKLNQASGSIPSPPSAPCLPLAGAARLQQSGAPRRFPAAASPDLRGVRRGGGGIALSHQRAGSSTVSCIRGRYRPHARRMA